MGGHGGRADVQLTRNRAIGKAHCQQISYLAFPLAQHFLPAGVPYLRSEAENAQHARCLFAAQIRGLLVFF